MDEKRDGEFAGGLEFLKNLFTQFGFFRESVWLLFTMLGIGGEGFFSIPDSVRDTKKFQQKKKPKTFEKEWQRLRDSNPCTSLERAVS
jgi:hypothetical protein